MVSTEAYPGQRQLGSTRIATALFWLTIAATGGSVMVVEIVGARLIGPAFGVGLFVWSALISVTLGALAVGYTIGGRLIDRTPSAKTFYRTVAGAGVAVALVPFASKLVLLSSLPLGVRLGPIVAATVLLAPTLLLLGSVSPMAIRLACNDLATTGRTSGTIYAVSTVSGVVGAVLTGFVLVPSFPANWTLVGVASLLLGLSIVGLVFLGEKAALALPLVFATNAFADRAVSPTPHVRVMERASSAYAALSVVEDTSRTTPLRLLRANHSFIGAEWSETHTPAYSFLYLIEAVKLARPSGTRMLLLGLGVGSVSSAMSQLGVSSDVVEIDPQVVRLAKRHFGFKPSGRVVIADARTFVRESNDTYDFIVHDTFTGGDNPDHLLSVEMLNDLKMRLNPDGLVVINIVGAERGPLSPASRAVGRTVREQFPHVRVFRDGPPKPEGELSNLLFFASRAAIEFGPVDPLLSGSERRQQILREFQNWEIPADASAAAPIITDNENPLTRLSLPVAERFHEFMNEMYPPAFWVN